MHVRVSARMTVTPGSPLPRKPHYVIPYIGQRDVQEINGAVCDALYAKLLAEGRVKAKPKKRQNTHAVHARRLTPDGRALPCRPYSYDTVRCFRTHAEDDPVIGRSIEAKKLGRRAAEDATEAAQRKLSPGLEPKTVVNTHRMLHRAWEDFAIWGWAKRNVVADAHPPRVPRKGRKVWTVAQLQTFLQRARSDRFFALWVLEATSGMRRCELAGVRRDLLDLAAGTLEIDVTRVVVDGKVIESDGKTENAQHVLALDPFTLAVLKAHVEMLDRERKDLGPDYHDHGVLFCWPDGRPPHPDTITRRFKQLAAAAGLPEIDLHDVRHSYATAGKIGRVASDASFGSRRERALPAAQRAVLRFGRLGGLLRTRTDLGLYEPAVPDATMMRLVLPGRVHHRCGCWHGDASKCGRLRQVHHGGSAGRACRRAVAGRIAAAVIATRAWPGGALPGLRRVPGCGV